MDPCDITKVTPAGSVEVGLGDECSPVADGQVVTLVCGTQGLFMFRVNARVRDLDVNASDHLGAIAFTAKTQDGTTISSSAGGCRPREFETTSDGSMVLTSAYGLALDPSALAMLEGARVTITVEVRDHLGHRATDSRVVVAHIPPSC